MFQPPNCGTNRLRRQANNGADTTEGTPATIEVYSGLYVNEANDLAKAGLDDDDSVYSEKVGGVLFLYQRSPLKKNVKKVLPSAYQHSAKKFSVKLSSSIFSRIQLQPLLFIYIFKIYRTDTIEQKIAAIVSIYLYFFTNFFPLRKQTETRQNLRVFAIKITQTLVKVF